MRRIIEVCRATERPFKVMPATWEVLSGTAGFRALREVEINDLLRRPPVALDLAGIGAFLRGKRVLITGAAGSIGSELCRQIQRFAPETLLCLDHDENALFFLERDLRKLAPDAPLRALLADITDVPRIDDIFRTFRPNVVFHAAAHKHVPLIEANPAEGMRNNVFGTECVATAAGRHGAEAFVMISTDKAVNPTSMMGASKRVAELVLQSLPFDTRYTAVRFGNVLGSQGSVVPLLKEQIAAGGPVTITHPDMRRYFMTIPEAVELVLQAGAMGKGDQILILDMGEPVKIVDLARDLITLSGLRPGVDIELVFSGVRPGEKLFEELFLEGENADRTSHPKILTARHQVTARERIPTLIEELRLAVARCDDAAVRRLVPRLVPEYQAGQFSGNVVPMAAVRAELVVSEATT
jgi:FlaA1/EpsC-like NDP-sugar epimerase